MPRKMSLLCVLLLLMVLARPAAAQEPPPPPPPTVTHSDFSGQMCELQCLTGTVTVNVPVYETPALVRQVDVAFVFDVTGSMSDVLNVAKRESLNIMADLVATAPDTAFAAASFADYPNGGGSFFGLFGSAEYGDDGDYPWRLDQDVTTDQNAVSAGINRMALLSGGDGPESYNRALYETRFLSWRPGAQRIVVLFGDAFPHDESYGSGADPGRDAEVGTADDLALDDVIAQLVADEIAVIGIIADSGAEEFFTLLAEQTGGQVFALRRAEDVPAAVVELVSGQIASIGNITLTAPPPYADWLQLEPPSYSGIEYDGRALPFAVQICPQPGTQAIARDLAFDMAAELDGQSFAAIPVAATYYPVCLPPVDVYVADNTQDDGSGCSNTDAAPFWESPDIVLRHRDDQVRTNQLAQPYGQNYLYVQVRNRGTEGVTEAGVRLYYTSGGLGDSAAADWREIGRATLAVPAEGAAWTVALPWTAPGSGPFRFLAEVDAPADPPGQGTVACNNNAATNNATIAPIRNQSLGDGRLAGSAGFVVGGEVGALQLDLTAVPADSDVAIAISDGAGNRLSDERVVGGSQVQIDALPANAGRLTVSVITGASQSFPIYLRLLNDGETVDGASVQFQPQPTILQLPPQPEIGAAASVTVWPFALLAGLLAFAGIVAIILIQARAVRGQ